MTYTLTSRDTVLGRTGVELPGVASGARAWHFLPTPAFESARPLLLEQEEATLGLQELMSSAAALASIRDDERDVFIHHALMSDPRAKRFLELMDAVEALGLALHDERGGRRRAALLPARRRNVNAAIQLR